MIEGPSRNGAFSVSWSNAWIWIGSAVRFGWHSGCLPHLKGKDVRKTKSDLQSKQSWRHISLPRQRLWTFFFFRLLFFYEGGRQCKLDASSSAGLSRIFAQLNSNSNGDGPRGIEIDRSNQRQQPSVGNRAWAFLATPLAENYRISGLFLQSFMAFTATNTLLF